MGEFARFHQYHSTDYFGRRQFIRPPPEIFNLVQIRALFWRPELIDIVFGDDISFGDHASTLRRHITYEHVE